VAYCASEHIFEMMEHILDLMDIIVSELIVFLPPKFKHHYNKKQQEQ
jgi:hypothetical protein